MVAQISSMLQWISVGLAALSGGLWIWSAKIPLNLTYYSNEPFVLEMKVLQARAEQLTNDAAIKQAFSAQCRLSVAAAICAFASACLQLAALYLQPA